MLDLKQQRHIALRRAMSFQHQMVSGRNLTVNNGDDCAQTKHVRKSRSVAVFVHVI